MKACRGTAENSGTLVKQVCSHEGDSLMTQVTQILNAVQRGDKQAASQLLPLVYDELRKLAGARLAKEFLQQSLNATALVHEAYLRLVGEKDQQHWEGRGHFFAAAAEAMRRILVDAARRRQSQKHGGGQVIESSCNEDYPLKRPPEEVLAVNDALDELAGIDARAAELVKLRYFGGFTITEIAEILQVSARTADNLWSYARAWLAIQLRK